MRAHNKYDLRVTLRKCSPVFVGFGLLMLLTFISALNSLAAEHPDSLYRQGRYKEAMAGYEKLDLDNPKDISYRFNRGCAAYQLKDYQSAQAAFTSVYARAQDNDLRFKAAYNLGNTGYAAGDFRAAADYYKEALRLNPQSKEARHNLELALQKLAEAKKQDQNKDSQPNQGQQCKNPQAGGSKKDQQQKDQQDKQGEQQQQQNQKGNKGEQQQGQAGEKSKDEPKKLSGELTASTPGQMQKSQEGKKEGQAAKSVERNKAEALLNNIQEDRSRYLRMQAPEDQQGGAKSGKYW